MTRHSSASAFAYAFASALLLLVSFASLAFGQGQPVNQVSGPPPNNFVSYSDVGSTPHYVCYAQALQPVTSFYISSGTLVSIAVSGSTGTITFSGTSYLWIGAVVTVAGATVAPTLNGSYSVTGVSGSTATITTSGVAGATYTDATMFLSTNAPLLNQTVWAIQVTQYASSNQTAQYWAGPPSMTPPMNLACSNRHNY